MRRWSQVDRCAASISRIHWTVSKFFFKVYQEVNSRLPEACLGSRARRKLATAEETIGSSPTFSRWALETPLTRTRLGDGRRLSGERCGGCGTIGEEIV